MLHHPSRLLIHLLPVEVQGLANGPGVSIHSFLATLQRVEAVLAAKYGCFCPGCVLVLTNALSSFGAIKIKVMK